VKISKRTVSNRDVAAKREVLAGRDTDRESKLARVGERGDMGLARGIRPSMCAQHEFEIDGVGKARCIDAVRLSEVAGRFIQAKIRGGREACGCYESRDIGDYDTCPHGCVYCYAVRNRPLALRRFKQHDPDSEYLCPPGSAALEAERRKQREQLFPSTPS